VLFAVADGAELTNLCGGYVDQLAELSAPFGIFCTTFPAPYPLFGLRNMASIFQNTTQSESLSSLKEDLDCLLKIREGDATASREFPILDNYSDSDEDTENVLSSHLGLTITSTPQGRFVY